MRLCGVTPPSPRSDVPSAAAAESYVFKFSTTPSQNGGIAKTGIHWGDVSQFPFIVGERRQPAAALGLRGPLLRMYG